MQKPEEYLARAVLADRYARSAMNHDLRVGFQNVAERWRRLADVAEIVDDDDDAPASARMFGTLPAHGPDVGTDLEPLRSGLDLNGISGAAALLLLELLIGKRQRTRPEREAAGPRQ